MLRLLTGLLTTWFLPSWIIQLHFFPKRLRSSTVGCVLAVNQNLICSSKYIFFRSDKYCMTLPGRFHCNVLALFLYYLNIDMQYLCSSTLSFKKSGRIARICTEPVSFRWFVTVLKYSQYIRQWLTLGTETINLIGPKSDIIVRSFL